MAVVWTHLPFFAALLASAACFALIEIQVEGASGWAEKLPTWRWENSWLKRLFPGRPLTGYHLWVLVFIFLMAHLPFAFGLPWSWQNQWKALAFIAFFWVFEDFFWFVLNPHFGVRRFRRRYIAWHAPTWWWIAPRDYWIGLALAIVLYIASQDRGPRVYEIAMAWKNALMVR